jgi:hypothetical protein
MPALPIMSADSTAALAPVPLASYASSIALQTASALSTPLLGDSLSIQETNARELRH